ncbi:uncharacterized protein HKBW3S25_01134 [Candidatus Hakubella thermalkaliphila]|uniref:Uncharacterized protein n=1 Tax=Candidatus Hakubella thermalkaliphila TaxID=2754717 RepID=A0A6V8P1W9_9ACTN|nr:uncharacterized protein HKBW3S25_01134 [Candidatus Hakubella thermalkaliphila]
MKNRDGLLTFALIALVALQALALLVSYDDKAVAKRLLQKRSGVEVIETDVSRAETSEEAKQLLEEPLTEEVTPEEPKSPEGFTIREVEIAEPQQKILADAKKQITEHIINKAGYYEGGYPPPGEGLATDVIARALRSAGYDLRELMYQDMKAYPQDYPWKLYEIKTVDKNIDFRRTPTIRMESATVSAERIIKRRLSFSTGKPATFAASSSKAIKNNSLYTKYIVLNITTPRPPMR